MKTLILAVLACFVAGGLGYKKPSSCYKVNCQKDYEYKIMKFNTPDPDKYCSFRMRLYALNPDVNVLTFRDWNNTAIHRECSVYDTKFVVTKGPEGSEIDRMDGDDLYIECCARPVAEECFYKVSIFMHKCADERKDNDDHHRAEALFRDSTGATVKAVFDSDDAEKYSVTCEYMDAQGTLIKSKSLDSSPPLSGVIKRVDCGMGVRIEKRVKILKNNYRTVELKAKRYKCNSQNLALFRERSEKEVDDPNQARNAYSVTGDLKFSVNTVIVDDVIHDDIMFGAYISPVLAYTPVTTATPKWQESDEVCGPKVRAVKVNYK